MLGGRRPRSTLIAGALIAATALSILSGCGSDGSADRAAACPPFSPTLTPPGHGPAAFTMGLRVNQTADVDDIADSRLKERIDPHDIFVVNTEFPKGDPDAWAQTVNAVAENFPCNRIATLNGLGPHPRRPGYRYALVDHPEVDAVLVDWEPDTWADLARRPPNQSLSASLPRIAAQLRRLAERIAGGGARMGLVPDYTPDWDYGRTGRVIARENFEADHVHHGYQVVQTQPFCDTRSGPGISALASEIRRQYRPLAGMVPGPDGWRRAQNPAHSPPRQLGFELAFDATPSPSASEAVERVGPEDAARCTREILDAGGAAILYWASPTSMTAMLDTPAGRSLRPPASG